LPSKRTPFLPHPTTTRNSTSHTDFATGHPDFASSPNEARTRKTPRELLPKHLPSRGSSLPPNRRRNTDRRVRNRKPASDSAALRLDGNPPSSNSGEPELLPHSNSRSEQSTFRFRKCSPARSCDPKASRSPPHGGRLPWSVSGEPSLADRLPGRRAPTSNVSNVGVRNVRARLLEGKPSCFLVFATVPRVFAICHRDSLTSAS